MGKSPSDDVYFLNRNKEYVFMVNYNIPANFPENINLQVELQAVSDEMLEALSPCGNKNHRYDFLFRCQDRNVPMKTACTMQLDKNASEMPLKCRFYCNNTCPSMFSRSALRFKLYADDGTVLRDMSYNVKISERSNRDERVSKKKSKSPELPTVEIKTETCLPEFQMMENKKQLPRLENINYSYPDFDVSFGDNKRSLGNEFFAKIGEKVNFNVHLGSASRSSEELFVKAMIVDPKNLTKVFACCQKHKKHGRSHVMQCSNNCEYVGAEQGVYNQDRLALLFPVQDHFAADDFNVPIQFNCNNSCFYADKKDTASTMIFTLENSEGTIYARRCFNYKIVERPSRCKFTAAKQQQQNLKRKADQEFFLDPKLRRTA
jgi:hypothetical protein